MYRWLRRRCRKETADTLMALWYALLILLAALYALEPPAFFRYGNI